MRQTALSSPTPQESTLEGAVDRIVFANEDESWVVVRLSVPGRRGVVTAVGSLAGVQPGETLRLAGRWVEDRKWGEQFKVSSYKPVAPATVEGIERYLSSGPIDGIGPGMAGRLVQTFGAGTLEIIENHPERLRQVPGIGPKRFQRIVDSWSEQQGQRQVLIFLQGHGLGAGYANRIFRAYGEQAEELVTENPYRLAEEIHGIGFATADRIAASLGVARDSPRRAEAGLAHLLKQGGSRGHVYLPVPELFAQAEELLPEVEEPTRIQALGTLIQDGRAVEDSLPSRPGGPTLRAIYSAPLHHAETTLAARLTQRVQHALSLPEADADEAFHRLESREGITLAPAQRDAVQSSLTHRVLVITGGPGTGKTTLLRAIVETHVDAGRAVSLAAPTGRAARRLSEATGRPASTVHRLLEFDPRQMGFLRSDDNPLELDLLVVDEASMLDTQLAAALLEALPEDGQLVLVGDVDQLPSVGPGQVLADLIDSSVVPVVRLATVFRQAAASRVVTNAHAIREGRAPELRHPEKGQAADFYFLRRGEPEDVLSTLVELVTERVPQGFQLRAVEDIQVLTPMNKGPLGVARLNEALQERLNPDGRPIPGKSRNLRIGDKVMQLRNNYDLEVFNGDLGRVMTHDPEEGETTVSFDGRGVTYEAADLEELTLAYACTIHKSQGSEYPCAVVVVHHQHFHMLRRNLLYTALTRAKRLALLVGQTQAVRTAVQRGEVRNRYTGLAYRLSRNLPAVAQP
ncbi:MAG: ATP-dependent RecD-like DNA helicase [Acidobacteriota bacterium]